MLRSCCVSRERAGLTLLELVVVMAILVALGGLLVPLLGNYLHRANVASCTTNIPELDKWMQTYLHLHAEYPTRFDNLVGGMAGGTSTFVMSGTYTTGETDHSIKVDDLFPGEATCLSESGITELCTIVPRSEGTDDWNPTFWPYPVNRSQPLKPVLTTDTTSVAVVTETGARLCGLPWNANYKYVIFGMNTPCTLFRNIVEEAPTHFADAPAEDPATWYMCFAAIFMVRDGNGNVPETAKYMGAVAFHGFGLATGGAHTKEWWDRLNTEKPNK